MTGTEAVAWGLVTGAQKAGLNIFFGSYPITPASALLHTLTNLKQYGVTTFQAEDEICRRLLRDRRVLRRLARVSRRARVPASR